MADDSRDNLKGTVGFSWKHYNPIGYSTVLASLNSDLDGLNSFGAGQFFDRTGTELLLTFYKREVGGNFKPLFGVKQYLFNRSQQLTFLWDQELNDRRYGWRGNFNGLLLSVGYREQRNTYSGSLNYFVNENVSIFTSGSRNKDDWRATGGLQINFTTGHKVNRRDRKKIQWIE